MQPPEPPRSGNVRLWAARGGAAFLDQALTSGANFGLSIYLGRTLSANDYGAYAIAFAIFLLVATLYQGAFLVPATLLGSTEFKSQQTGYVAALVRVHWLLSFGISAVFCLASLVCAAMGNQGALSSCLLAMAVSTPMILLLWLARTAWYLRMKPASSAMGTGLYLILLVSTVVAIELLTELTAARAILATGFAGMVAGGWLLLQFKPDYNNALPVRKVWESGWQVGRWEMAIALAAWLPASLCYPVTASVLGEAKAGILRALQNFSLPIAQAMSSVLRLAQPYVSSKFGKKDALSYRSVWAMTAMALALTSGYLLFVTVLRQPLMHLLYHGKFMDSADLLPWIVLPAVFATGTESLAMGLRAMLRSKRLLLAYVAASLVYLVTGIPAAKQYGLPGVAATLVFANLAALLTVAFLFRQLTAEAEEESAA